MKIKTISKIHNPFIDRAVYLLATKNMIKMRVKFGNEIYGEDFECNDAEREKEKMGKKGMNTLYLLEKLGPEGYEEYIIAFYEELNFNIPDEEKGRFQEIDIPQDLDYPIYFINQ